MILHQFEAKGLSHFSYAVGDKDAGEIAIIDPERDIQTYLAYAAENRLRIKYILETHIHADFASGARELSSKTDAGLLLSGYDKGEKFEYKFDHKELKDGEIINIGKVKIQVLHTPGHTPEHISFLTFDTEKSTTEPAAMFSGDFLFIGSVGRPDLLGEEDKMPLAKKLYRSVTEKLKNLPDSLEVYPGHGAGSLCGAGMSKALSSTLGDERKHNPYLQTLSEKEFTDKILGIVPPFPEYYIRMKKMNSEGPKILDGLPAPKGLTADEFAKIVEKHETIVDVRHPLAFGGGHIEGAINIGMGDQLGFWGAWFIPYNKPIYLVIDDESKLRDYVQALIRVGYDDIAGYLKPNFSSWANKGKDFEDLPQASVHSLNIFKDLGEKLTIVDVRSDGEFEEGHIKGAKHIYLGYIPEKLKELPGKDDMIFCVCGGGSRSSLAASLLLKRGYENVYNVFGGMTAWKAAEYPVVTGKK
jgi:hydroxyacylglutathione hydrolase